MPNTHSIQIARQKSIRKWVDRLIYIVAIGYPLSNIPQVAKIYLIKDAEAISLLTMLLFTFFAACWIVYGIIHNEKPIYISNIMWITTYIFIIIGIFLY